MSDLAKPGDIPVITSEGGGYLSKEDAIKAFRDGSARAPKDAAELGAIQAQHAQALEAEKYGGTANALKAFGVKAVDVTGLARPLATGFTRLTEGDEAARTLDENLTKLEQYHGLASGLGTAASFIAPGVAAKGFGALAKGEGALAKGAGLLGTASEAATLPMRGLGAVGRGVEGLGTRVLGEGALGQVAGKALGMGAETALLGAQGELSHQLTEEALGNHALNAERIFQAAGHDFTYGAILGGALGVGSVVGKKAIGGVSKLLGREALEDFRGEQIWKAAGPKQSQTAKVDRWGVGHEEAGRIVADEAESTIGRKLASREDLGEAIAKGIEKHGGKIDQAVTKMDAAMEKAGQAPKLYDVALDAESAALKRYEGMAGVGKEAQESTVKGFFDSLRRRAGLVDEAGELLPDALGKKTTLQDLWKLRQEADSLWTKSGMAVNLRDDAYKAIRDSLEDTFLKKADLASELGGAGLKAEYQAGKRSYSAYAALRDAFERGNAAAGTNQFLGLTDKIVGSAAGAVGGMLGGGLIGGAVAGGIGGLASKAIRAKFPFAAANLAERASKAMQVAQVAKAARGEMDTAVQSLLTGVRATEEKAVAPVIELFGADSKQRAPKIEKAVAALNDVAAQAERVAKRTQNLGGEVPRTQLALSAQTQRVTGYLLQQAPKAQYNGLSLTPWAQKPTYDDAQTAKFAQAIRVAANPLVVVHSAAKGRVSRDDVAALKAMYPETYQDARQAFIGELVDPSKQAKIQKMPLDRRLAITTLFDIPTPLTDPGFVAAVQRSIAEQGAQSTEPSGQQTQRRTGDAKAAAVQSNAMKTDTERLATDGPEL